MAARLITRHVHVKVMVAAVAAAVTATAAAQPHDNRNAATWYRKSFERLEAASITPDEWAAIKAYQQNPGSPPTEVVRSVLARVQPVLSAVVSGARQSYSDFEIEYAQGYSLQLPHVGALREVSRLMAVDALARMHEGDAPGAADRVAAMYRVSDHLGRDETVISSLVAQSLFANADAVASAAFGNGTFGPAESQTLGDALNGLGGRDPFGVVDAIDLERQMMGEWLRAQYTEAQDRASILEDLSFEPGAAEAAAGMMLVEESQFDAAIEQADAVMGRIVEAFAMSDPGEARLVLDEISEEIRRGEHGPLALLLPQYSKLFDRMKESEAMVAARRAALDPAAAGEAAPGRLANAAVWYLRAAELISAIEPPRLALLRQVTAEPAELVEPEASDVLAGAGEIVEAMDQAFAIDRCDFSIVHGRRPPVIPPYLGGLREVARLLLADAVRLWQAGETEQAARRLAMCYRLAADLGDARIIACSVAAHAVFASTSELVGWALELGLISPGERRALALEMVATPYRDPFGYALSITEARRALAKRRVGIESRQAASEAADQLDGDDLMYLLVVYDSAPDAAMPRGLDDVVSAEAIARARDEAARVRALVAENGLASPFERDIPDIAGVERRRAAAQTDLRAALLSLQ